MKVYISFFQAPGDIEFLVYADHRKLAAIVAKNIRARNSYSGEDLVNAMKLLENYDGKDNLVYLTKAPGVNCYDVLIFAKEIK